MCVSSDIMEMATSATARPMLRYKLTYLKTNQQVFCLFATEFLGVALDVLEFSLDQTSLKLTEIHLPLTSECWD